MANLTHSIRSNGSFPLGTGASRHPTTRRQRRVRQETTTNRTRGRTRRQRARGRATHSERRRLNPREEQRRQLRRERLAQEQIHRRIEIVNAAARDEPTTTARGVAIRSDVPRLSIYGDEPVALYVFSSLVQKFRNTH